MALQKPPYSVIGSTVLAEWLRMLYDYVVFQISDHNSLNDIQGGISDERYHLTSAEYLSLTNTGSTTLHKHDLVNMDSYSTGTWTPSFTNLTVVLGGGSVTYSGRYTRIGRMVFFQIRVVPAGGATTAATGASTYSNMGVAATQNSRCTVMNETVNSSVGNGLIDATNDRIYVPTWAATTDSFVIVGEYEA